MPNYKTNDPHRDVAMGRAAFSLTLGEMRKAASKTQEDVARTLEIDQAEVSRLEHRNDVLLSSLRRYARAIGAECEVAFVFPETGHRVIVKIEE